MPDKNEVRDLRLDTVQLSEDPKDYYPSEGLLKALEISIALGKPLLLSGEPGTGKTQFAHWAAQKLAAQTAGKPYAYLARPHIFPVKSGSAADDLFYTYDAVSHFRSEGRPAAQFIELNALGLAIAQSHGGASSVLDGMRGIRNLSGASAISKKLDDAPRGTVVLIDEIDKAPREFPNDLLHEIEDGSFNIPEIPFELKRAGDKACRTTVIITSNSEKNLPNAFLRRCVFYHIEFPAAMLLTIAKLRLQTGTDTRYDAAIGKAIQTFMDLRGKATTKKPTTSEFLDWLGVLRMNGLLEGSEIDMNSEVYKASISTLLKTTDDMQAAEA